jgi:hypothetical protein
MAHRAGRAFTLAVLILGSAANASAQSAPAGLALLPAVPELRLSWPLAPLSYRYSESEEAGYRNGPLQLFRAESLWFDAKSFKLYSIASSERALELDCSVTCQPVTARTLALEARLMLPRVTSFISEPHVFVRQSSMRSPLSARATGAFHVGLGGFLDF